jgi:TRAP-type C4-dicarboxylate transport system permease small subunit
MGFLIKTSDALARLERWLLIGAVAAILFLILLNVVTRAAQNSIYWVDESAIFAMVFCTFIGASLLVRQRVDFAVTLLTDFAPRPIRRWAPAANSLIVLFFACMMLWLCWNWFDPVTFAQAGFDPNKFFGETFNDIYREMPSTIGVRKVWFYLVMPWFSATMTIHALANLSEDVAFGLGREPAHEREEAKI